MRLIFGWSAAETKVGISSWRFRLRFFEVRMWRVKACVRFTLPEPVLWKRFFAPECDFNFGIAKPQGLKPQIDSVLTALTARLKSCPVTNRGRALLQTAVVPCYKPRS